MSRRLLFALLTAMVAAASVAAISISAQAHDRGDRPCVVTVVNTWLSNCHGCDVPVYKDRAFRAGEQVRDRLWVWNGRVAGWVNFRALRLEDGRRCRADGI